MNYYICVLNVEVYEGINHAERQQVLQYNL
jgi:hypothetical protein